MIVTGSAVYFGREGLESPACQGPTIKPAGSDQRVHIGTFSGQCETFFGEAKILASLFEIPGIVKVLDYFQEEERAYCVMEYVRGISLRSYLERREEPLTFEESWQMLLTVLRSLEKVHKKKLLHRDFNPDNLLVQEDGSLKLIDFGSARQFVEETDASKTMTVLVKDGYAPPEQYLRRGSQGPWTDIYAICATVYEMVTGCIPENALETAGSGQSLSAVRIRGGHPAGAGSGADEGAVPGSRAAVSVRSVICVQQLIRLFKMRRSGANGAWQPLIIAVILLCSAGAFGVYPCSSRQEDITAYAGNYARDRRSMRNLWISSGTGDVVRAWRKGRDALSSG